MDLKFNDYYMFVTVGKTKNSFQNLTLPTNIEDMENQLKCDGNWSSDKKCPYKIGEYHNCPVYVKDIAFLKQLFLDPKKIKEISETPSQATIPFRVPSHENSKKLYKTLVKPCMPPIVKEIYEFCLSGGSYSLKEYCINSKEKYGDPGSLVKAVLDLT